MKPLSTIIVSAFICFVGILLGPGQFTGGDSAETCCVRKNVPSECHFLCGSGSAGFFVRWKCRAKYYATIKTCEVHDAIDYVKMFGRKLTTSVAKGFEKLSVSIKQKLQNAKDFIKLSLDEVKQIPQDVFGSLQEGLEYMSSGQLVAISNRLKYFTKQNLHNVLSRIPTDTFKKSLAELNLRVDFDHDQLREFALTGLRSFGKHLGNWTKDALNDMNTFLIGLENSEILEIASEALRLSKNILCEVPFNADQKSAFLFPAKKAFGQISDWDDAKIKKICSVIEIIPPTEILKLSAKAVGKTVKVLSKNKYFVPQTRALIRKIKETWGEVNSWDNVKLKDLGNLLQGLDKKEISSLIDGTVKKALEAIGKIPWDEGKAREWVKKAKVILGDPDEWTVENLKELGHAAVALLPSELQGIGNTTLLKALNYLKEVKVHVDQAQIIVEKVKAIKSLKDITREDLIAMQNVFEGFLSSDIGKLSTLAVTAAFPEIIIVKKIGIPVARAFIQHYKKNPGDGKIGVLKSFATALTRVELNETKVKIIVDDLERLGVIDWDATQALELMQRIKGEWGRFNDSDDDFSDDPKWGFRQFKKLGKIVVGLAKEDLRELPVRGIEDIVEVLGRNTGWSRGQIVAAMKRVHEYWEVNNLHFSNLTETDINALGEFIAGVAVKDLEKLPRSVLHIAIKRLGEKFDLPEDKLRARAYLAIQFIKNETGTDILDGNHVVELGNLLKGVNRAVLKQITQDGFLDNLHQITRIKGMSDDRLSQIVQLAKKHFKESDVGKWIADQWRDLGPALKILSAGELGRINKEAFDEIVDELGELDPFTVEQARALIQAAKKHWKQTDVAKWTGEQLRKLGSLVKGLNVEEIKRLSEDLFKEAVGVWGERLDLTDENLKALALKARDVFVKSDATKFVAEQLKMLGRIVLGLTPEDLEKLKIDNVDVLAALGKWKGWKKDQLAKLRPKIREFLLKQNDPEIYMSLGYLAEILKPNDIKHLSKKAFELSVKLLGANDDWSQHQLDALAEKTKKVWGSSDNWEKSQVSEIGKVVRGLKPSDLSKLQNSVVDAIKPETIEELDVEQLKAFSPEQFSSMDSSQLNMISEVSVGFLSAEQRRAVENVKQDDPVDPDPWPQESCEGAGCPVSGSYQLVGNFFMLMGAFLLYLTKY